MEMDSRDTSFLPVPQAVAYTPVPLSSRIGLEAALSTSVLLGSDSAAARAAAAAGELSIVAARLHNGVRTLYAYRGVTRSIHSARGDVDAARLSGAWIAVLLPELSRIAKVICAAMEANGLLARTAATCGSAGKNSTLPPPVAAAALHLIDALVTMDALLASKPALLVDIRWLQSALEMHAGGEAVSALADAKRVCGELLPIVSAASSGAPLLSALDASISALPREVQPAANRFTVLVLEHALGVLHSRVHVVSADEGHGAARSIAALLFLLVGLSGAGQRDAHASTNGAATATAKDDTAAVRTMRSAHPRLVDRALDALDAHRVVHAIGDAFVEPAALILPLRPALLAIAAKHRGGGDASVSAQATLGTPFAHLSRSDADALVKRNAIRGSEVYVRESHDRVLLRVSRAAVNDIFGASASGNSASTSGSSTEGVKNSDLDALSVGIESLRLLNEWNGKVHSSVAYKRAAWSARRGHGDTSSAHSSAATVPAAISASNGGMGVSLNGTDGERSAPVSAASELIDGDEMVSLLHVISYVKGLSSAVLAHKQQWLQRSVRALVRELHAFILGGTLDTIAAGGSNRRRVNKVVGDLVGRIKGCFNTAINVWSSHDNNVALGEVDLENIDVVPARLHPVLMSIQCLLWELLSLGSSAAAASTNSGITQQGAKDVQDIMRRIDVFATAIELEKHIVRAASLHDLWFREMYIEQSESVQLPISLSIPWLLVQSAIAATTTPSAGPTTRTGASTATTTPTSRGAAGDNNGASLSSAAPASLISLVLVPLEIYNDCCRHILSPSTYGSKVLYDEIEAEVDLVFDQLIFTLATNIFRYYKIKASTLLLESDFYKTQQVQVVLHQHMAASAVASDVGDSLASSGIKHSLYVSSIAYKRLLYRNYPLLGRRIDIAALISASLTREFRANLEHILQRLEGSELCYVIEFEMLLTVLRRSHSCIADELGLELENFDDILVADTADTGSSSATGVSGIDDDSATTAYSRIATVVLDEILHDILPNFTFNAATRRFVRAAGGSSDRDRPPLPKSEAAYMFGSKILNMCFTRVVELHSQFIGTVHLSCIDRLLGGARLVRTVECIVEWIDGVVHGAIAAYAKELFHGLPPPSSTGGHRRRRDGLPLPPPASSPARAAVFYQRLLAPILSYPVLYDEVLPLFAVAGNALAMFEMLDAARKDRTPRVNAEAVDDVCGGVEAAIGEVLRMRLDVPESGAQSAPDTVQAMMGDAGRVRRGGGCELLDDTLSVAGSLRTRIKTMSQGVHTERTATRSSTTSTTMLSHSSSVLSYALKKLQAHVQSRRMELWSPSSPSSVGFCGLWSALLFAYVCPPRDRRRAVDELGDGFFFCGLALVSVMGDVLKWELDDCVANIISCSKREGVPQLAAAMSSTGQDSELDAAEEEDLDVRFVLGSCRDAMDVIEKCADSFHIALGASLAPDRKQTAYQRQQQQNRASSIRAMMAMRNKAPSVTFRSPPPVPPAILAAATASPPPPSASTLAAIQAQSRPTARPPPPPPAVLQKLRAMGTV